MKLTLVEGADLIRYARKVIEGHYTNTKAETPSTLTELFKEKRGVFVTLHKNSELRGCIGYPEPVLSLGDAITRASLSAALEDPRFPPVKEEELDLVIIEVSVLSKPDRVEVEDPKQFFEKVIVGRDGLIAERGLARGLLLPQVPVEQGWDVETFITHTCLKAGLLPDEWSRSGFNLYTFSAQIFAEKTCKGEIVEKSLSDTDNN